MTEETVLEKRQNNDQRQFTKDTQKTKTKTQLMVIKQNVLRLFTHLFFLLKIITKTTAKNNHYFSSTKTACKSVSVNINLKDHEEAPYYLLAYVSKYALFSISQKQKQ